MCGSAIRSFCCVSSSIVTRYWELATTILYILLSTTTRSIATRYQLDDDMAEYISETDDFQVSSLAYKLNSLPRFDLAFHRVDSTFKPQSQEYKESLIVWTAAPFVWLFITLTLFLIYFCCRCCMQHNIEKKHQPVCCLRWSLAVLTVISCVAIGFGFYGNESANKSLERALGAVVDVVDTVQHVQNEMLHLNHSVTVVVSQGVDRMHQVYQEHPELSQGLRSELTANMIAMYEHAQNVLKSLSDIGRCASYVNVAAIGHYIRLCYEFCVYRHTVMLVFFALLTLFCIMLIIGVGKSSKCTLLLFCAFGIFSLVQCWMLTGAHLGVSLMIGDFCTLDRMHVINSMEMDSFQRDIIKYYIKCDTVSSPFKKSLQSASDHLKNANLSLTKAVNTTQKFISKSEFGDASQLMYNEFDRVLEMLMLLTALIECTNQRKNYIKTLHSVCNETLPSVVLLTLSAAVTGLLFSVLIILASVAWRHFGNQRAYVDGDDENGTFLTRHVDTTSPSHYSVPRGRQGQQRDLTSRRTTPPPAYNSGEFYRHYEDVNSSDVARSDYGGGRDQHT